MFVTKFMLHICDYNSLYFNGYYFYENFINMSSFIFTFICIKRNRFKRFFFLTFYFNLFFRVNSFLF